MDKNTLSHETIVYPKGFRAASVHSGIKKEHKDISLVASTVPANAAGCFTSNVVKAAPVVWDQDITSKGTKVTGIVINSGNANACTGAQGKKDCCAMARTYAEVLGCQEENILVCSTGVIGVNLPMEKIVPGIKEAGNCLGDSREHGIAAAEGIMTTDTYAKHTGMAVDMNGKEIRIGGMSKGSGMIHPNMATMLAFITTDAAISGAMLQKALKECTADSFNMISVDGDTSTNDTILVLANGLAGNEEISAEGEAYALFKESLMAVCKKLAIDVVSDGEGATKLMEVTVTGADSKENARMIARSVTSSSLFKAALFGEDANWGRVLCAMGYSGGSFDPDKVTMSLRSYSGEKEKSLVLMEHGMPVKFDEGKASAVLKEKKVYVDIVLKMAGTFSATAWGCDLTYDYVKINGDYRS